MRAQTLTFLTFLTTVLLAAGCTFNTANTASPQSQSQSHAQTQSASSPPACRAPEPATLPHAAGSLTEADSGAFCLGVGQILDVFLAVPALAGRGARWTQIKIDDTSVVAYGNSGVLTPPVGITPGVFVGAHSGATTISSSLPNGVTWQVTLVVKP